MSLHRALTHHWLWCCPRGAHRTPGRGRGMPGRVAWPLPSSPITSFLLREPSLLRQHEARGMDKWGTQIDASEAGFALQQ